MTQNISRRKWLKSTALASLAFPSATPIYYCNVLKSSSINRIQNPIKLSSNENPYGPSKAAHSAIVKSLNRGNRYPNILKEKLRMQIAKKENLTPEHVLLSAGSTEILAMLGNWLSYKKGMYLTTHLTFPVLMQYTESYNVNWIKIPLDRNFRIDINLLYKSTHDNIDAIYLCNPNNPTGTCLEITELEQYFKSLKRNQILLIDEAYIEYSRGGLKNSMAKLVSQYPNILIIRTFSKIYGLAGLRIGYALGNPTLISTIKSNSLTAESSLSSTGLSAAIASLENQDFVVSSYKKNKETRNYIISHFDKWNIPYTESETNFLYFPIDKFERNGNNFRKTMSDANIQCPPFSHEKTNYSRMTIGTKDEMEKVISVLQNLI